MNNIFNNMDDKKVILITGSRKGIGRYLAEKYLNEGMIVIGCSRTQSDLNHQNYKHFNIDVVDEKGVKQIFKYINSEYGRLDILLNNAGIASMNHALLTSMATVNKIFSTNVIGMFLFCREASKLMIKNKTGRIVNFTTVAVPLKLEGEAIYAASKASVNSLTEVLSVELADLGITVNAVGPTPVKTDLIKNIPEGKMNGLLSRLPLKRLGTFEDVSNVVDFFINPASNYITGQIIYLGGVS
jgi:3-oxoacyl-[acyl-carrier protein] reductase